MSAKIELIDMVIPDGYSIIYADPPWSYRNKKTGGSMKSGAINKYPCMTTKDICKLPIKNIVSKNSVLFLWVTTPMLEDGLQVMREWGFKYKTMITWRKIMSLGMGYWFRGQTEHLLMGIRGKVRASRCQKPNFVQAKVLRHSEKPEEFRKLIEEAFPNMKNCIELFARKQTEGWTAWGNEI